MNRRTRPSEYVVCVDNRGFKASLVVRKIYEMVHDETASEHRMVRVVDESAEDYMFPSRLFLPIDVPADVRAKWGPTSARRTAKEATRDSPATRQPLTAKGPARGTVRARRAPLPRRRVPLQS